jgi:putative transposase
MNNHIHLIWQMLGDHKPDAVQRDFLKYTAQQIKFHLQNKNPELLEKCRVQAKDRTFQIWKRKALSIDIYSQEVMLQKLNYTHPNPVKAGLVTLPEQYLYSSTSFYLLQGKRFEFLSQYRG